MGNDADLIKLRDKVTTGKEFSLWGEYENNYLIPLEKIAAVAAGSCL